MPFDCAAAAARLAWWYHCKSSSGSSSSASVASSSSGGNSKPPAQLLVGRSAKPARVRTPSGGKRRLPTSACPCRLRALPPSTRGRWPPGELEARGWAVWVGVAAGGGGLGPFGLPSRRWPRPVLPLSRTLLPANDRTVSIIAEALHHIILGLRTASRAVFFGASGSPLRSAQHRGHVFALETNLFSRAHEAEERQFCMHQTTQRISCPPSFPTPPPPIKLVCVML